MQPLPEQPASWRAALFVDFDNIYLGLHAIDPAAAERFASDPARWLAWFEKGLPGAGDDGAPLLRRSVLIRRCYLNPAAGFHRFRRDFTHAGFAVIDCPPLTLQGKNSSDIAMVIDILDTLNHPTHFDEFIILSADSDFTLVLLRLREYERRTAVLTIGATASAYKAACDHPINGDVFIKHALGLASRKPSKAPFSITDSPLNGHTDQILNAIAHKAYAAAGINGGLLVADLVPILRESPAFTPHSNWLGFGTLRNLASELIRRAPGLRFTEDEPARLIIARDGPERTELAAVSSVLLVQDSPGNGLQEARYAGDPARHILPPPVPEHAELPPDSAALPVQESPDNDLRGQIISQVHQIVADSPEPVPMTKIGWLVINALGQQVKESRWAGAGSLKNLIQKADLPSLKVIMASNTSSYLYDPTRHAQPTTEPEHPKASPDAVTLRPEPVPSDDLARLIEKVHRAIGIPTLTSGEYALVFQAMAEALQQPYDAIATSRLVQQHCLKRGLRILQIQIAEMFNGIRRAGHEPGRERQDDNAMELAKAFRNSVIIRCDQAALILSDREDRLIDTWILGARADQSATQG